MFIFESRNINGTTSTGIHLFINNFNISKSTFKHIDGKVHQSRQLSLYAYIYINMNMKSKIRSKCNSFSAKP